MGKPLRKNERTESNQRLTQLEKALAQSRAEYRTIFGQAPIAIWEEDFSAAGKYVNDRRAEGVQNIRSYLAEHPADVKALARAIKIYDLNKATLREYAAGSRAELEEGLQTVFGPKTYDIFQDEIAAFADGQTVFTGSTINETLTGEKIHIDLKMCIVPGSENDWSRVLVFITKKSDETT